MHASHPAWLPHQQHLTFDSGFPQTTSGSFLLCRKAMVVKCGVSAEGVRCVWRVPLNQTSGLQGHPGGGWGDLAGDDLGTGSGWKQSRQNQTPLCSDETRSPNTTANLSAALAAPLHFFTPLLADGPHLVPLLDARARHGDARRLELVQKTLGQRTPAVVELATLTRAVVEPQLLSAATAAKKTRPRHGVPGAIACRSSRKVANRYS